MADTHARECDGTCPANVIAAVAAMNVMSGLDGHGKGRLSPVGPLSRVHHVHHRRGRVAPGRQRAELRRATHALDPNTVEGGLQFDYR